MMVEGFMEVWFLRSDMDGVVMDNLDSDMSSNRSMDETWLRGGICYLGREMVFSGVFIGW